MLINFYVLNRIGGEYIQMSNENEVLLNKGKQNDSNMKVVRKEGEPTPAFIRGFLGSSVSRCNGLSHWFVIMQQWN